jgi:hypothetical protein
MPLRVSDLRSLAWLCRWYNGRAERLKQLHNVHLANLITLALETSNGEIGWGTTSEVTVNLCGFAVTLSLSPSRVEVLSIKPPAFLTSDQLELFAECEDDLDDEVVMCKAHSSVTKVEAVKLL